MGHTPLHATVLGARGFIGNTLVAHLHALGWICWLPERCVTWPVDDRPLGHVFYCAGLTVDYAARPADTVEAHVGLLSRVLQSANFESLVYLSSTRLYDGLMLGQVARESVPLTVSPATPRHFYDLSKLTGESLCYLMGAGRARVARLSSVYDTSGCAGGFLPELLLQIAAAKPGETLHLASSANFARDYVHIDDVVRALVDIAVLGTRPCYNVASGVTLGNAELAEWIERGTGRKIDFNSLQNSALPADVSIDLLQQEFGWRPLQVQQALAEWQTNMGRQK